MLESDLQLLWFSTDNNRQTSPLIIEFCGETKLRAVKPTIGNIINAI